MRFPTIEMMVLLVMGLCVAPQTSIAEKPPKVGERATDFTLPIVGSENEITLSQTLSDGPVVLVVLRGYPGYQCPLCSRQVGELAKNAESIEKLAAKVILVYPGEPTLLEEHAKQFIGDQVLPKPMVMVRDPGMNMVSAWNLRWDAPRETAYPSTFIIDSDAKVRWARVSTTHGGRSSVEEILSELRKL